MHLHRAHETLFELAESPDECVRVEFDGEDPACSFLRFVPELNEFRLVDKRNGRYSDAKRRDHVQAVGILLVGRDPTWLPVGYFDRLAVTKVEGGK